MTQSKISLLSLLVLLCTLFSGHAFATNIAQSPLYLEEGVPPIVMITMGRDHKLYYEAYNDASDLDGDGKLDIRYTPVDDQATGRKGIDYYGYFDSYKCYDYTSGKFVPVSKTTTKKCDGTKWSGDFLNYLTTSRMDALRKVLYGGSRDIDNTSETILERAFIPQDGHSWGKQYTSSTIDGYNIADYAPFSEPSLSEAPASPSEIALHPNPVRRHLFASTTLSNDGAPVLRVLENINYNHTIVEWVSKESPVAGDILDGTWWSYEESIVDYNVLVKVCVPDMLEENCKAYSDGTTTTYKPTGLLQRYGDDELMSFGLLTGSYKNNMSGGVVRKNISSFQNEVNMNTGMFETGISGIVDTIDKLRIQGFDYTGAIHGSGTHSYGGYNVSSAMAEGDLPDWGNPIAEMMYEGLRYFAGKGTSTSDFSNNVSDSASPDNLLGLPLPTWQDPYRTSPGGYPSCAKPIQLVISDVNNSYDTDQLPGISSSFGSGLVGDLPGLNVSTLADTIWAGESEATNVFIGQSGTLTDDTPSPKPASSFKNIRGLAPEEPAKKGGYYAGSVALYGKKTDISGAIGKQNIDTIAVVLASPLPRIEVPVGNKTVTLVPFAKSVYAGAAINSSAGAFQPTDQIVDFYVKSIENFGAVKDTNINHGLPKIKFSINFEDVEAGNDHDMDAIVEYTVSVKSSTQLDVTLVSQYAEGSIIQHMGYVISGTLTDGTYLEVRDEDTDPGDDQDYFLDTPQGQLPGGIWDDNIDLPLTTTRTFTVGSASASFIKHPPLWYAAKWSMTDDNENGTLETDEWDNDTDGDPDGYFLVTNAGKLEKQLEKAFAEIEARTSSSAAVATNSTRLDANTKIYQARFNTANWDGQFRAFEIEASGAVASTYAWDAAEEIPDHAARKVYSYNPVTNAGIEFLNSSPANLSALQLADLDKDASGTSDSLAADRINYLRGDQSEEESSGGVFRNRTSLMGDIINSDPWFVGNTEDFGYSRLSGDEGSSYAQFKINKSVRTPAIYFGANDGMLHAVNAANSDDGGDELFTYVPDAVISSLTKLTSPNYGCTGNGCIAHQYFVDGAPKAADAYVDLGSTDAWHTILLGTLGAGGKGLFALDVTDPTTSGFSTSNVLWEISATQSPDDSDLTDSPTKAGFANNLGYTLSQASIVRMHNGNWAAIVSNGYDSVNGKAVLFIIDIETGTLLASLDTKVGSSGSPNGLSTPIPVDIDGDRIVDNIYAGDLQGNLWKFDVTGGLANWKVADMIAGDGNANAPLYIAKDANGLRQPITAKPQVGNHPDGGLMVYFGTGKYYAVNDQILETPNVHVHTFYGIRDLGTQVTSRDNLQQQQILHEITKSDLNLDVRVVSDTAVDYTSKKGWYLDLVSPGESGSIAKGERVVSAPLLRDGRIIFSTLIPTEDPCGGGGDSWLMELDAVNGNRLNMAAFGDAAGMVTITIDGVEVDVYTSGVSKHGLGIVKTPSVISTGDKTEKKYLSGTSGNVGVIDETASDPNGRQSWQQIK